MHPLPEEDQMSPTYMGPDETFGDRLIAASMFIDIAIFSMTKCPTYPENDEGIAQYVKTLTQIKSDLLGELKTYPAGSMKND